MKKQFIFLGFLVMMAFFSCHQNVKDNSAPQNSVQDSLPVPAPVSDSVSTSAVAEVKPSASPDSLSEKKMCAVRQTKRPELKADSDTIAVQSEKTAETSSLVPPVSLPDEGTLVYYCPARMLENSDNNVSVSISKEVLQAAIEHLQQRVAATSGKSPESIRPNIAGSAIHIATKMKVELKYSERDFETIYKPENADQIFDGDNDMNWDWIVRPLRVGTVQLSIIVSAFDEKNGRWIAVQTPPRIFNIKVQIDPRSYFSKLWGFLQTNPEWLFVQILFPVIAFFYGKRKGKKKR